MTILCCFHFYAGAFNGYCTPPGSPSSLDVPPGYPESNSFAPSSIVPGCYKTPSATNYDGNASCFLTPREEVNESAAKEYEEKKKTMRDLLGIHIAHRCKLQDVAKLGFMLIGEEFVVSRNDVKDMLLLVFDTWAERRGLYNISFYDWKEAFVTLGRDDLRNKMEMLQRLEKLHCNEVICGALIPRK